MNFLRGGDFAGAAIPEGWFTWQADDSHGATVCADGRLAISAASEAVAGFLVETKPGVLLAARLRVRTTGAGQGALTIRWKTADGKWTAMQHDARYFPTAPADTDGWCEITGVVEVPKNAGQAVFMASVASQLRAHDRCEFDDAELVVVPQE